MVQQTTPTIVCHALTVIDGSSEEVVDVHEIAPFDLVAFTRQFDVPVEHDPQMLDRYAVGPDDVRFLNDALGLELDYDFTRFAYFIEPFTP